MWTWKERAALGGTLAIGGIVGIGLACLRVARPHEILVRTGFLVRGKQFGTSLVILPHLQRCARIDLTAKVIPGTTKGIYTEESHEIGIRWVAAYQPSRSQEDLECFVDRLSNNCDADSLMTERVNAQLRSIAARNKLANINVERAEFAKEIEAMLSGELQPAYGINIKFNIENIDSTVLKTNSQQLEALATSTTTIKVETARQEAARRTAELRRETAVVVAQQERLEAEANAELRVRQAELSRTVGVEQAQATATVENANIDTQTQTLRAQLMAKANVAAEVKKREAEATATALEITSKAELFANVQHADGVRQLGLAEGDVILAKAKAEAYGVKQLVDAMGGNSQHVLGLRLVASEQLPTMAAAQAQMLSKANMYFTGGSGATHVDTLASLAPTLGILKQHGYDLPGWMLSKTQ